MNRIGIVLTVCAAMMACSQSPREDTPRHPSFSDEGIAAQDRIGRYLQDAVTPKLRACWGQLKGEGLVALDLTYTKSKNNWAFENAKVTKSTLTQGQDATALRCMEESARATGFAVDSKEPLETAAMQFLVRLAFSVPLPAEGAQLTNDQVARMIGSGGGVITTPGCSQCVLRGVPPYGYKCESRKSGSNVDCEEVATNVCAITPKACLRGAFGGTRGVIMY